MKLKKKNRDYFRLLVDMTVYASEAAKILKNMLSDFSSEGIRRGQGCVQSLRRKCGEIKRGMADALAEEFLPPLEREDLFFLACVEEECAERACGITSAFYAADIRAIREDAEELAELVVGCCGAAERLVKELGNFKKSDSLQGFAVALDERSERGRGRCGEAARRLSGDTETVRAFVGWREIYGSFAKYFESAGRLADGVRAAALKNL